MDKTQEEEEDLPKALPCPKCNSENLGYSFAFGQYCVCCVDCGHRGPWTPNDRTYIHEWNLRR